MNIDPVKFDCTKYNFSRLKPCKICSICSLKDLIFDLKGGVSNLFICLSMESIFGHSALS